MTSNRGPNLSTSQPSKGTSHVSSRTKTVKVTCTAACSAWRCFCRGGTKSVHPYWKFATATMLSTLKKRISHRFSSRPARSSTGFASMVGILGQESGVHRGDTIPPERASRFKSDVGRADFRRADFRRADVCPRAAAIPTLLVLLLRRDAQELLAAVLALEEAQERRGSVLEPLLHVDAILEAAFLHPARDGGGRLGGARQVVEDDEPLHAPAPRQQVQVVLRAGRLRGVIVARDGAAEHHPAAHRQPRQGEVEDLSTHVVEEDVDAVRAQLAQLLPHVLGLVVDRGVEAIVLREPAALLRAARDPDRAAPLDLRDLA